MTFVSSTPLLIESDALIKLIIGFVNLDAKEIATAVDKNNNRVTTIIYMAAKVILIPVWLFSTE